MLDPVGVTVSRITGAWWIGYLPAVMDPEIGQLYLGVGADGNEPLLYDSADLTTHGVIVGMTGSGKTGLGIDLIEEALLSGISCLVIDPKGDMGNLLLNFPDLRPADFQPWIDPSAAERSGKSVSELAEETAAMWEKGLTGHRITPERMRRLKDSAEITIYTPGSAAGVGLDVLGSMKAPAIDWATEAELARDEIGSLVSSLLVLAGIESDPVSGPEHILLATIVETNWRDGRDLDLAALVSQIPKPPFRKMGVFDIDTFFPEKDRMALALELNGLLASPSFAAWMEGVPLEIDKLIGGDEPKAAIIYLSHLTDEERQFLVTLLLGKTVTWIRSQPGTSELRALIYMDEVFGFAPPTREPPSKKPILTILKQARAHGVGMVLATQNPVDLDYKAMSNAGTWMVGRLQTENDKRRILEGLASVTGEVDISGVDKQISDLEKRQFVLHSAGTSAPRLFSTRWAMSYLAGPLTRDQVSDLMAPRRPVSSPDEPAPVVEQAPPPPMTIPTTAEGVTSSYLDPAASWAGLVGADPMSTSYRAGAVATAQLLYDDTKSGVNHQETFEAVIFPLDGVLDAGEVITVDHDERDFLEEPPDGATHLDTDVDLAAKSFWRGLESDLTTHLVGNRPITVWRNPTLDLYSRVGETREEYEARCAAAAEQAADADLSKLKDGFQKRFDRVRSQMADAQSRYHEANSVAAAKSEENMLGTAGDLLGAFLGGRSRSGALKRVATRRSAAAKAEARADSAASDYHAKQQELTELEEELAAEVAEITGRYDTAAAEIEEVEIPLEKSDVRVADLRLVWIPVSRVDDLAGSSTDGGGSA
jgi:hypothetical protein